MSHNAENDAPCQSCGISNRTCFLEGGYCCITCQDDGGTTHESRPIPPETFLSSLLGEQRKTWDERHGVIPPATTGESA